MELGLGPGHMVARWGSSSLLPKRGLSPPIFSPFLLWPNGLVHQDALGMEVDLSPGDCVRQGPSPTPPKGAVFSPRLLWCRGRPRVGLRDIVLDGDSAPPPLKGHSLPLIFD